MGFTYGVSAYGILAASSTNSQMPPKYAYDKVEFYGQNVGIQLNDIWGRNIEITDDMIDSYINGDYNPIWDNDTYMLATFNNETLDAGNILGLSGTFSYWTVYRNNLSTPTAELVGTYPKEIKALRDYAANKKEIYEYQVFANTDRQVSLPLPSNQILHDYEGYFLIDMDNSIAYRINVLTTDNGKTLNMIRTEYQTNTQYPTVSVGQARYISGGVGGLLLTDSNDVTSNTINILSQFREFIYSNRRKLLKNRKGEMYSVSTYDYSESVIDNGIISQPCLCTFSFSEVGDVKDLIQ